MAEQYWVWALDRDNMPLASEGPWGPYDAQTARTYGRISATEGRHDRAVSRGQDPKARGFEIMRIYRAGTGQHVYAGGGVIANGMQRNEAWEGDYIVTELEHPGWWNAFYVERSGSYKSIMPNLMRSKDAALTFVRDHARDAGAYHAVIFEERAIGDLWQIGNFVEGRMQMTANEARPHSELKWYKITYSAPAGGTAVTHVRAPNSFEALERAAFQIGYEPEVWSIEGMLNGGWTRL